MGVSFCTNCGKAVKEGQLFCKSCGAKVDIPMNSVLSEDSHNDMEDDDELSLRCRLSYYQSVAVISASHSIELVQHTETHQLYVKKETDAISYEVLDYIRKNPILGTPRIYELFRLDGKLTIIEEFVGGQTLQNIINKNGRIQGDLAIKFTKQICEILNVLHNANPPIIHRDIKPDNIIIDCNNNAVLLDMDIAKRYSEEESRDTHLLGTTGYAAPEQYGFGSSSIQTDIFAVGVLLNKMLTGKEPYESQMKGELGKVIAKCTQIDPKQRYKSVKDIANDLDDILRSETEDGQGKGVKKYALPGFRTKSIILKIISLLIYVIVYLFVATLGRTDVASLVIKFSLTTALILLWGNYLGVQYKLGIKKKDNIVVRALKLLGLTLVIVFLWLVEIAILAPT